jgi:tetratricopeptide (TPR) repeat protein
MNRQQRRASKGNGTGNGAGNGTGGGSDDSRLDQAMALHQAGRLMEADAHYRQILEQHPTDPNALRLRGALAYQLGNPAAAAELLAEARKADPKNPEVLTLLGLALEGAGNPEAAEQAYRKALSLSPKSPEIWNNLGALLRETGTLQKAAEAFGRAVVLKPDYVEAYQNLGVTLYRMGSYGAALAAFETGLNYAPNDADMMLNYGVVLSASNRVEEAAACFKAVLELAPDDPDSLTNLAAALMRLEQLSEAEDIARHALSIAPESAGAMANLAMILTAARHFDEAEAVYHDALRATPDFADIWGNFGNMLTATDRLEEAAVAYDKAYKLDPSDARHAFQLALCHLGQGNLAKGWALYESGLDCGERVPVTSPDLPRWQGDALKGRRLLIVPEQGMGDEIRSLSCLPDVVHAAGEGANLLVGCDPRLQGLVQRAFPTVETIGRPDVANAEADVSIPVASLPKLFRNALSDFPETAGYFTADPDQVAAIKKRLDQLGSGMKVGIAWRSGLRRVRSQAALTEIAQWQKVLSVPNAHFVNLQYGVQPEELEGRSITHFDDIDLFNDLDGAAALTQACDLVINMGTSVGDMAGALDVPCWSLLLKPEWITLGAERHPFYPNTDVFWRMPDEEWPAVLARVAERLALISKA